MATDSARSTAPPAARQLWQVPLFFLGLAALVAVPWVRPYWKNDRASVEWQLHAARAALDQTPPDLAQAVQRGRRVLDAADRFPDLAGEAHFVVGSARLRLADEARDADRERECQQAREHLEQAETRGVADDDRPKLQYRLAKARLLTGAEAAPAVAALEQAIDAADDPAEGYGLLADAYLRLTPPDPAKALEAAKRQVDRLRPAGDPRVQAQARLRLGKLYLQAKNVKDGRLVLARIGEDAPPDLYFDAKALLAQSYEVTEEWEQASRNWERAKQDPRLAPADKAAEKARLLYRLGRCYAQEQRPREAAGAWEEALKLGGDEAQAAALRLAGLKLDAEAVSAAVEALAAALGNIHGPDDYRNTLVPADEARKLLETAAQLCRAKGEWESAHKVAELYGRLASPTGADVMAGLTADEWAKALAEQIKQTPPEQAAALDEQRRAQLKAAGLAYEKAAGQTVPGPDQANWLANSADRLIRAGDLPRAIEVLNRFTQLEGVATAEQISLAWFKLAQAHHHLQQFAAARAAYQHCLTSNGPFVLSARLELARIDMTEGRFDDAEQALQANKKLLLETGSLDVAAQDLQAQTAFALAEVAYQRQEAVKEELREYGTAEQRLLGALQQHPDGPLALRARMLLARSYWDVAALKSNILDRAGKGQGKLSEEERQQLTRQQGENLQKSAEQCDKVADQLLARQRAGERFTADEASTLMRASYMGAECFFWMLRADEAVRRYGTLALRYQRQPEELIARSQLFQRYWRFLNKPDLARDQFRQIREAVDQWPETVFGKSPEQTRAFWVDWLANAAKLQEEPKPPAPR